MSSQMHASHTWPSPSQTHHDRGCPCSLHLEARRRRAGAQFDRRRRSALLRAPPPPLRTRRLLLRPTRRRRFQQLLGRYLWAPARLAFRKLVMSHNSLAKKGVEELLEKVPIFQKAVSAILRNSGAILRNYSDATPLLSRGSSLSSAPRSPTPPRRSTFRTASTSSRWATPPTRST